MARRRKELTEKLIDDVAKTIRLGNFRRSAFAKFGVLPSRYGQWIRMGLDVIEEKIANEDMTTTHILAEKLVLEIERAEAEAQGKIMENVAACDDPNIQIKFLERRYAREFSKNPNANRQLVDGNLQDVLNLDAREILVSALKTLLEREDG